MGSEFDGAEGSGLENLEVVVDGGIRRKATHDNTRVALNRGHEIVEVMRDTDRHGAETIDFFFSEELPLAVGLILGFGQPFL